MFDPPKTGTSRIRGQHPASYCSSHISAWLLQFFASRASTLYNRTVPTRSERRCSTDIPYSHIRNQSVRAHRTKPILQLHWLPICWPVQFKLCCFMHAVVTGCCPASGKHRVTSHTVAFRSATVIFRLLCTADKDQIRREGLLLRRPVCVEHTAAPYPRNSRLC